jgi:hypothetical protein
VVGSLFNGPAVLQTVSLNPSTVVGGNPSQGTVTLNAPAPSGGAVVTLSSSNTAVATVPPSVTVAAGNTTATFSVTTVSVSSTASSNISGTYGGSPIPATLTVNPPSSLVSQAGWVLKFVDSEATNCGPYGGVNAFDGNPNTFWHTEWCAGTPGPPHEIQIDMGATYTLTGFHYLPRQDGSPNGDIKQYEFYVSSDGVNWGTPVATGNLITVSGDATEKQVTFGATTGRYIRLRALSEVNGLPYTNVAELNVVHQ